jgi:hypothetical protein
MRPVETIPGMGRGGLKKKESLATFWINNRYVVDTLINCDLRQTLAFAGGKSLNILAVQQSYAQTLKKDMRLSSQLTFQSILLLGSNVKCPPKIF